MEQCNLTEKIENLLLKEGVEKLSREEMLYLEEHLKGCGQCSKMKSAYDTLESSLKSGLEVSGQFPDAKDLYRLIVQDEKSQSRGRMMHWKKAAIFFVLVSTGLFVMFFNQSKPEYGARSKVQESKAGNPDVSEWKNAKGAVTVVPEKGMVCVTPYMEAKKKIEAHFPLGIKDMVTTGKDSQATVHFSDFVTMKLKPDTALQYFQNYIHITQGRMEVKMFRQGDRFQLKTPTAMAGILGTEFTVSVRQGRTDILVREGIVKVWNEKGEIQVSAGQKCHVYSGELPEMETQAPGIESTGRTGRDVKFTNTGLDTLINK